MKTAFWATGFVILPLALAACLMSRGFVANQDMAQSECVNCHTNGKQLVILAREIEKVRPKPGPSPESTGEC